MKAIVDKNICLGCGACTYTAENVFEIGEDGLAEAIEEKVKKEDEEEARNAQEGCPVDAITLEEE